MVESENGAWRKRKDYSQPFLFVRTNSDSHESRLHFKEEEISEKMLTHSLDSVNLLPVHPDTYLFRYTYATFYDRIYSVDKELGKIIDMLREDNLLDNTFIFYFGDNGGCLPGSKGYTSETGLKVPLIVYIPEKWRDKIPLKCGEHLHGLVSFVDFGPTLLHLVGINVPNYMDGTPFLGEDISKEDINDRKVVYCYGDRFDELYAFNRTIRVGNYKYSRNFLPYHPKSLFSFYRYKQLAFKQWKNLYEKGCLNNIQSIFFEPQGAEELYDLNKDPYETNNLASLSEYKVKLNELRSLLDENMINHCDLGLLPECVWLSEGEDNPYLYGVKSKERIKRIKNIVDMQLQEFNSISSSLEEALNSNDPVERWWALTVCASFGNNAVPLKELAEKLLKDDFSYVRMRAIVFLSMLGSKFTKADILSLFSKVRFPSESLLVINDLAFMMEKCLIETFPLSINEIPINCNGLDWRVDYINDIY